MEEMIERYKQELYNYRQRSQTREAEPLPATAEVSATADPETAAVFAPAREAAVPSDGAEAPVSAAEGEIALRQADAPGPDRLTEDSQKPPSTILPSMGTPAKEQEEAAKQEEYERFLEENPGTGTLKLQVYTGRRSVPLARAAVYVTKDFNGSPRVFFSGVTDGDGIVSGIELPAPPRQESQQPENAPPYSTYDIYVDAAGYRPEAFKGVPIFDGIQSIQPVSMTPSNGEGLPPEIIVEEEPDL